MLAWYVPSATGDFRLEKAGEASLLTVEDPTPHELDILNGFLAKARSSSWVDEGAVIEPRGRTELAVAASVQKAGAILAGDAMPKKGALTAVRSKDGTIVAVVDMGSAEDVARQLQKVARKNSRAVTTRRPTLCCPNPIEGPEVRSSHVLRAFCTAKQWASWVKHGWLTCRGGLTHRLYRVAHRHHPLAIEQGFIGFDVQANEPLHCYDWRVPPAEEVLSVKLVLEHREDWIRNPSGWFYGGPSFDHPFGFGAWDGTWDTGLVSGFGQLLRGEL